jgi:predicted amidophosphoribosyltransferase
MKFEGLLRAAEWLAEHMVPLVEEAPGILVPVPRTGLRRVRYGIDTAFVLARAIGRLTGRPVRRALRAPIWSPRHTARASDRRGSPTFYGEEVGQTGLLIDDVVTSGSTLIAAAQALGFSMIGAVTATRTLKVTSLLGEGAFGLADRRELSDRR